MTTRTATCQCGALSATCVGDPVRVSVCHCLECQKRSGAPIASQARFPRDRVTLSGDSHRWSRTGDEGGRAEFHFCPTCGSTVWYVADAMPDLVAVAVGAFADPRFPPPEYSVYEARQHSWLAVVGDGIEHYD